MRASVSVILRSLPAMGQNLHGNGRVFELVQDRPLNVADDAVHGVPRDLRISVRMVEQTHEHGLVAHDERGRSPHLVRVDEPRVLILDDLERPARAHVRERGVRISAVLGDQPCENGLVAEAAAAVETVLVCVVMKSEECMWLVVAQRDAQLECKETAVVIRSFPDVDTALLDMCLAQAEREKGHVPIRTVAETGHDMVVDEPRERAAVVPGESERSCHEIVQPPGSRALFRTPCSVRRDQGVVEVRKLRVIGVVVALLGLPLWVGTPASADAPESWDLNPATGRPYDFNDYTKIDGWQGNPSAPTAWGLWPLCTGTTRADGKPYAGGRSKYCVTSVDVRRAGASDWVKMAPKSTDSGLATDRPSWSADWSSNSGKGALGGVVDPQVQLVGKWFVVKVQQQTVQSDLEFRVSVDIGDMDVVAMKSSGSNSSYSQAISPSGTRIVTAVARSDGAGTIIIPPPSNNDVCVQQVTATRSTLGDWSVIMYDRKMTPELAGYDGGVVESDAYPSSNVFFPLFDQNTGQFKLTVCSAHFKSDGSLNLGYYRLVLSPAMLHAMGYYLSDANGNEVTDARGYTATQLEDLRRKVEKDFVLFSSEQPDLEDAVSLVVNSDGSVSVKLSAEIHYSGPTMSAARTGNAVWMTTKTPTSGRYLDIRYRSQVSTKGTLVTELRTQKGALVARSSRPARSTGTSDLKVPASSRTGQYVLRVYIAGAKVKGKAKITKIQDLPVSLTKGG